MSLSTEYQPRDLRRADFLPWLNMFLSLGGGYTAPLAEKEEAPPPPPSQIRCLPPQQAGRRHRSQPEDDAKAADAAGLGVDTPDTLSAAVEVKFLLPVHPRHNRRGSTSTGYEERGRDPGDGDSINRWAHESVASTIAAAGGQQSVALHDILAEGRQERDFWDTHWIVKKANSAHHPSAAAQDDQDRNAHWVPVEICSPKQRLDGFRGAVSLEAVSRVLRALQSRHRVVVNYTCDVHVHVGRADGRALSLVTLKRLATMLWLSEGMLRRVRDPASPNFRNVFTWGAEMREHSRLAIMTARNSSTAGWAAPLTRMPGSLRQLVRRDMGSHTRASRSAASAISAIWQAASHLELGRLLSGPSRQYRRLGFNFSSLGEEDDRARTGPKTVEFRVLDGTLEEDAICAWVVICWKMLAVAGDVGGASDCFAKVVRRCCRAAADNGSLDAAVGAPGEDVHVLRGPLRGVLVGCMGVEGAVYDAFVRALMRGREKQTRGVVG